MGESAELVAGTADGEGVWVGGGGGYLVEGRVHCPQLRQPAVGHVTHRVCGREDGHGLQ